MLKVFERDIQILASLQKAHGFEIDFVFQPMVSWIDKNFLLKKKSCLKILDNYPQNPYYKLLAEGIVEIYGKYSGDVERICRNNGLNFLNLNECQDYKTDDWLFVDRTHLNNKGYDLTTDILKRELSL